MQWTLARACRRWLVALLLALGPAFAGWPADAVAALRVAVISDLNGSYGSTRYEPAVTAAVQRLVELKPDLVISTGDMVAGQRLHPPLDEPAVQAMWTSFHDTVTEPLARARIPFAVTPGNHDASAYETFALERETFRREWLARRPALRFVDDAGYPFRYAFAAGGVLFVALDVTRVGAIDADEKRWLSELLSREAARYRQRVVFSHLPVYPFTQGRETEVSADHDLERILRKHGVDVYLSGHHHAFYPGYREGIRFVSQACLGAGPRALLGTGTRSERAITLLEVADDGSLTVRALAAPDFRREIERSTLPRSISSRFGTMIRDDLTTAAGAGAGAEGADRVE
jgi:3',5'-cyclic AMP phosphodiesterase CpdA